MPRHYLTYALLVLGCLLLGCLFIRQFAEVLDRPVVHQSWSTKECVRVEDPAAEHEGREPYTCERMPERYQHVWVY